VNAVVDARGARRVASRAATGDRLERFGAAAIFVGCLAFFLISPMLLTHWGVPYETAGGAPLQKVHPGTWLTLIGLLLAGARFGGPIAFARAVGSALPGVAAFAFATVFLFWQTIVVQSLPFTPLIDSFVAPMIVLLALATQSGQARRRLALALHAALFADALLGLSEYLLGFRLTPYVAGEFELETDWRATALIGHPLSNALMMGCYLIVMALGGGRDLPAALRPVAMITALASMVAFGGRTSMVLAFAAVGLVFLARFGGALAGRRVSTLGVAASAALAPVCVVALMGLYAGGFFDQMIERFVNDNGSANARLIMLKLFDYLSWEEILLGPDPRKIIALQNLEGIEYGLESFYVAYVLTYGAIVAGLVFAGLLCFCREIVRASSPRAAAPLLFFFVVAATSVSLSAKTTTLGMLIALTSTMLRPSSDKRTS
jgi:hypothetical protein